jgi:hypothetical protein
VVNIAGIDCTDFNQTIFNLALDYLIENATFSDSVCVDTGVSAVAITTEVAVLLFMAAEHGSILLYVQNTLEDTTNSSTCGKKCFTSVLVGFATFDMSFKIETVVKNATRRLDMSSAEVTGIAVATFGPSPAPSPAPTFVSTAGPSVPPTAMPSATPTSPPPSLPAPVTTPVSTSMPTRIPDEPSAAPTPALAPTPTLPNEPSAVPIPAPTSVPTRIPDEPSAAPIPMPTAAPVVATTAAPAMATAPVQMTGSKSSSSGGTDMTMIIVIIIIVVAVVVCFGINGVAVMKLKSKGTDPESTVVAAPADAAIPAVVNPAASSDETVEFGADADAEAQEIHLVGLDPATASDETDEHGADPDAEERGINLVGLIGEEWSEC